MFVATFSESFAAPEQVKGLNRASGTGEAHVRDRPAKFIEKNMRNLLFSIHIIATNEHDTVFIAKLWIH